MEQKEFEQIIREMQKTWLGLGVRFFGNENDARDALQETLLRLWVVRERLHAADDVKTLGTRIMKNECVSFYRKEKHSADEPPPDAPTMEGNPHTLMAGKEQSELLQWAISNLPESTRCLIQLQLYEGMTLDEISAATGKTKGSVKTMISNAKHRIALWLKTHQ